ncbi:Derlin-1 [Armadillidium nasatum]|uniref:Derlin n=1 Tax=Armadillidium nasatum TaxID=96803 RepID=A0A5N5SPF3_9CRUS|nr:Derlin-1 [Armadillidium nasatum]
MGDIGTWFSTLPTMTKYWFGGTIAVSLMGRFGLLNPHWLILHYGFIYNFHLLPYSFYYPINPATGFHFLINLYFLYNYSLRLETGMFAGRPADYLFMLLFMWTCCVIVGLLAGFMVLMDAMVISVLYIWCQLNKDMIVSFWFGTQFKAIGMVELAGILIGHFYYFLAIKYPQDFGGVTLIQTPQFLYNWFPNQRGYVAGFGQAPQFRRPDRGDDDRGGLFRGRGHTLGN